MWDKILKGKLCRRQNVKPIANIQKNMKMKMWATFLDRGFQPFYRSSQLHLELH